MCNFVAFKSLQGSFSAASEFQTTDQGLNLLQHILLLESTDCFKQQNILLEIGAVLLHLN